MNFVSPSAARVKLHFCPAGEARAAAAAHVRLPHLLEQLLGRLGRQRGAQAGVGAAPGEHRLVEDARGAGSGASTVVAPEDALDDAGARIDDLAVADGRRQVAEAQADRLGQRHLAVRRALPERQAETVADLVDVGVPGRGVARGAGADPDMATTARGEQVVVEGGDAVDGRLGQARALCSDATIVVGDLTASVHRLFQHVERRRRPFRVVAADQLYEISRHVLPIVPVERIAVKVIPTTSR